MSAALGWAQMQRIDEIIQKRQRVADMYKERLARVPGVWVPRVSPEVTRMSWFVYVIRVGVDEPDHKRQMEIRDHVMKVLTENEVGCRPYFTPIHLQPFYREMFGFKEGDFPVTEERGGRALRYRPIITLRLRKWSMWRRCWRKAYEALNMGVAADDGSGRGETVDFLCDTVYF